MKPVELIVQQPQAAHGARRGRLFRKYFLLILALVCGALLLSGAISVYFSYQENKVALARVQHEKAVGAAARIEQFVLEIDKQLAFAALPQLGGGGAELRRIEFLKLLKLVPAVTDVAQIDARGREQLSESRLAMSVTGGDRDRSNDPAFVNAKPGQTWFSPVYFRKETEPYMSIAVRSGGERGPVTVAEVNLKFVWDVVTRIKIGERGKAYVVDASGHLVADPDIGLVLRKTDLSTLPQVQAALTEGAGEAPAMLALDLSGKEVLSAYAPIDPLGWKVFVEQPVSEVFATLDASILRTVVLMVAGLLLSAFTALWLARSMVQPIRTLQEGAQRIGAGELDSTISIKSGDELEALAEQFNDMTARLRESYAGLERKVEARTAELQETLEQQTATSEILRVISSSPGDVQPVFDTIARHALELCDGMFVNVFRFDGELVHYVASHNLMSEAARMRLTQKYPMRPDRTQLSGRTILSGSIERMQDVLEDPDYDREYARVHGWRSMLGVPMVREGKVLGAIVVGWSAPGQVSPASDQLLSTFADQAVIAIENVRLFNETKEALEQQTAISEILRVISSSPGDMKPVLDAVAERAARICDAKVVDIILAEGSNMRVAATMGSLGRSAEKLSLDRTTVMGRSIVDQETIQVADLMNAPESEYPTGRMLARKYGHRTILAVPLLRENRALGTILLRRQDARPFDDKHISLLKTFADQAAIAIENVRLFNETKEALEQQKASADVLEVISGSVADTTPVFDKILESCERLFTGRNVGITLVGEDGAVHAGAYRGPGEREFRSVFPVPLSRESGTGTAILERRVLHYPDVQGGRDVPEYTRRGSGQTGTRSIIIAPMLWEGRGIGAVMVGRDFTGPFSDKEIALLKTFADQAVIAIQNVRLFNEIQDKSHQLEIANQHKSDFLANMSHELRTPLNAIIGFSEVLIERMFGELNEKQADYLKDIHDSGKHLLSLINDILDLSKIEAGRMDLELTSFDLPGALANAMTLVRERAQRHGIALGLEVDPKLGQFSADERKFKQIVLNLLSNAVKFTPDGGRVDVRANLDTGKVEIAVKDTGVGIAPEDQAAVFEEFKQVGRDYTRKAEGTGLGLALTRRFVELHGGAIRLESEPGKGSTFTVTLPVRT